MPYACYKPMDSIEFIIDHFLSIPLLTFSFWNRWAWLDHLLILRYAEAAPVTGNDCTSLPWQSIDFAIAQPCKGSNAVSCTHEISNVVP